MDDLPRVVEVPPSQQHKAATGSVLNLADVVGSKSTETAFNDLITSNTNVVVDFYADWCGPCKALSPILASLAGELRNIVFIKVNVDTYKSLSNKYGIRSIPTILCFKNGTEVKRLGKDTKSNLHKKFKEIFG